MSSSPERSSSNAGADQLAALGLFAEAIVGEPIGIEDGDAHWPHVPADGSALAVRLPIAAMPDTDRRVARAIALHQLVACEEERPHDPVDESQLRRRHPLLPETYRWIEDARIAALAQRRYPGARQDLRLAASTPTLRGTPPSLIAALRNAALGRRPSAAPEVLDAIQAALARVEPKDATREDSLDAAVELLRAVAVQASERRSFGEVEGPEAPEAEIRGGSALDSAASPDEVEDRDGTSGGIPVDQDMLTDRPAPPAEDESDEPAGGLQLPTVGRRPPADVRTFLYDEWDFRAKRHRRAWCRVLEERLQGDDPSFITDVRSRHRALRAEIRKRFGRLRPEQLVRIPRSLDGEELDLDAAIGSIVDRRSGAPVDERHHVRRDRAARDVATVFLVDLSASTSSPVEEPATVPPPDADPEDDPLSYAPIWDPDLPPPEPPRRVIDVAKDAVALMCDALTELGDRHAVYGFSGSGRDHVQLQLAKALNDPVSPSTWAALAAMRPLRYTRMGPAIRHATAALEGDSARTRLLIVISDGYPQDVEYGEDPRDREYGMHDTARALADAQAAGVDTFCLTIDPAGHDYLRRMAPERRYLVIDDVEALPEELAKVYLGLAS